jgi:response regulator NasT
MSIGISFELLLYGGITEESVRTLGVKMTKKGISVVVIDDEPITRMDLKEMLEGKGCHVLGEAGDGFDAIELCRKNNPDLVLLDIKMPLLDGISAAKIIHDEGLAETVILLTAYNEKEFIEGAKKSGV